MPGRRGSCSHFPGLAATTVERALSVRDLNQRPTAEVCVRGRLVRRSAAPRGCPRLEVGIGIEHRRLAHPVGDHADDGRHRDAETTDARDPTDLVWSHRDRREHHRRIRLLAGPENAKACPEPCPELGKTDLRQLEYPAEKSCKSSRPQTRAVTSKLAGPGSPRLGRFDSFAASCRLEIGSFRASERSVPPYVPRTRRWEFGMKRARTHYATREWRFRGIVRYRLSIE